MDTSRGFYYTGDMKTCSPRGFGALGALLGFFWMAIPLVAADQRIRVVCDDNYPPYSFRGSDGKVQGIIPDQWKEWELVTGIAVDFVGLDWQSCLLAMDRGEADVIDSMFRTTEREKVYDFLEPYATIRVPVFFHQSISGISRPEDLRGFRVAAKAGDASIAILKSHGVTDIMEYPDYEDIIRAAVESEVRIFCVDEPPARYLLYKYGADRVFRSALNLFTGKFHRAVRKNRVPLSDGRDLLAVLEEGFAAIPRTTYGKIERKWFGEALDRRVDPSVLAWSVGGVGLVIALLAIFILTLRAQVARKTRELSEKNASLEESERRIVSSLAEKEVLLKEVYHRVKNNLQVISGLIQLQAETLYDERDRSLVAEMQQRIKSMALIHERLYRSEDLSSIDGAEYLQSVIEDLQIAYLEYSGRVRVDLSLDHFRCSMDVAVPLGLIVNEVVSNSFKYAFHPGGGNTLSVSIVAQEGGSVILSIADDGPGLPENWEERASASLGFTLIRLLASQLKGRLTISPSPGTSVTLEIDAHR